MPCFAALGSPLAAFEVQTENIRARISEAEFIVNICIYEQTWISETPGFPRAQLVQKAIITGVYKGAIAVGTKLEYRYFIEEPQRFLEKTKIRSGTVEGELRTFFFSSDEGTLKNGKYTLESYGFSFPRCDENDGFAKAFRQELKTNPALKPSND